MTPRQLLLMQGGDGGGGNGGGVNNMGGQSPYGGSVTSSLGGQSKGFAGMSPSSMDGWGGRIGSTLGSSLMNANPMTAALGAGIGGFAGGWSPGKAASVGGGTLLMGPLGGFIAGKAHDFWSAPGSGFFGMEDGVNRDAQELSTAQSIAQEDAAMNGGGGGGWDGWGGTVAANSYSSGGGSGGSMNDGGGYGGDAADANNDSNSGYAG